MTSFARRFLLASCCGALLVIAGCDESEGEGDSHQHDHDAGHHHHDEDAAHDHDHGDGGVHEEDFDAAAYDDAPCTVDYPEYRAGMSVNVGAYKVELVSATPAPPRQKVKNDWVVRVLDGSGAPVSDLALSNPASFMPVHNHYGRTRPKAMTLSEPGQAMLDDIDFQMRGPWQVLFDVAVGGAPAGTATFQVCVR